MKRPGLVLVAPGFLTISAADHALVRQGEREHVADLQRAFLMTHQAAYDAALALSQQVFPGSPPILAQLAAMKALRERLPGLGERLGNAPSLLHGGIDNLYHALRRKTKERDDNQWHTLRIKKIQKDDPYRIEASISYKHPYEIGTHSSEQIVAW